MSPAPFTRRKFLLTSAAATSSAWLLAAWRRRRRGSPPGPVLGLVGPPVRHRQGDGHRDDVDVLDLGSRHQERGEALHHQVPEDQGGPGQRRSGRPALSEAADRDPVRAGCARRRPGRVPVHQLLHPRRRQPARPHPVRTAGVEGQLRRLDLVPGQHERRTVGDPAGHRPDGSAVPRRPAQRGGHRGAQDVRRLRHRCCDLPLQEPEELPGERRPEPARPDRGLSVAGRCPPVRVRRQADGQDRPRQ